VTDPETSETRYRTLVEESTDIATITRVLGYEADELVT